MKRFQAVENTAAQERNVGTILEENSVLLILPVLLTNFMAHLITF